MYLSCSVDILDQINNHGKPMEEYSFWTGQCTEVQLMDRSVYRSTVDGQVSTPYLFRSTESEQVRLQSRGVRPMFRSICRKMFFCQVNVQILDR